jgi:hypothetical protein
MPYVERKAVEGFTTYGPVAREASDEDVEAAAATAEEEEEEEAASSSTPHHSL